MSNYKDTVIILRQIQAQHIAHKDYARAGYLDSVIEAMEEQRIREAFMEIELDDRDYEPVLELVKTSKVIN